MSMVPSIFMFCLAQVSKSRVRKDTGAVTSKFKEFDLASMGVPQEAWPLADFPYKGSRSFTVRSRSGAVPSHLRLWDGDNRCPEMKINRNCVGLLKVSVQLVKNTLNQTCDRLVVVGFKWPITQVQPRQLRSFLPERLSSSKRSVLSKVNLKTAVMVLLPLRSLPRLLGQSMVGLPKLGNLQSTVQSLFRA